MPPVKQDLGISIREYFDERLKSQEKKLDAVGEGLAQLAKDIIRREKFEELCKNLSEIKIDLLKRIDEIEHRVSIIEAERKIEFGRQKVIFLFSDKLWMVISAVLIALIIKYL
jgi:hypothetical protein